MPGLVMGMMPGVNLIGQMLHLGSWAQCTVEIKQYLVADMMPSGAYWSMEQMLSRGMMPTV